jgi:hypothetical protein
MKIINGKFIGTSKELAKALRCTERMLLYYSTLKENPMPKHGRNQYEIMTCMKWHEDYEIQLLKNEIDKLKNDEYEQRIKKVDAERKEFEFAEKKKQFVHINDHYEIIDRIVVSIKTKVPNWPRRAAPEVFKLPSVKDIESKLNEHANRLLNDLSNIGNIAGNIIPDRSEDQRKVSKSKAKRV